MRVLSQRSLHFTLSLLSQGFAPAFAALGLMHRDGLGGCARDGRLMQAQFARAVDHGYPVQQARSLILDTHHAARL